MDCVMIDDLLVHFIKEGKSLSLTRVLEHIEDQHVISYMTLLMMNLPQKPSVRLYAYKIKY